MNIGDSVGQLVRKHINDIDLFDNEIIDYDNKFMLFNIGIDREVKRIKMEVARDIINKWW